jgi:hypothetical protein
VLRVMLFETRIGEWLLTLLEGRAGLAIIKADWLGDQRSGCPMDSVDSPGQQTQKGISYVQTNSVTSPRA